MESSVCLPLLFATVDDSLHTSNISRRSVANCGLVCNSPFILSSFILPSTSVSYVGLGNGLYICGILAGSSVTSPVTLSLYVPSSNFS